MFRVGDSTTELYIGNYKDPYFNIHYFHGTKIRRCFFRGSCEKTPPREDETEEFLRLSIDPDHHIPVIHLHFNDDLTEVPMVSTFWSGRMVGGSVTKWLITMVSKSLK